MGSDIWAAVGPPGVEATDINALIAPESKGWVVTDTRGVNTKGQVIGKARNPAGKEVAFLATPRPAATQ